MSYYFQMCSGVFGLSVCQAACVLMHPYQLQNILAGRLSLTLSLVCFFFCRDLVLPLSEFPPVEKWARCGRRENWHNPRCWRDGAQEAQQHTQQKSITQTFSPPSGNWSQPLRTETISRFVFFPPFILTLSPCGCCTAGVELHSEVFQKERKVCVFFFFLSDAQTGAAWLIVK